MPNITLSEAVARLREANARPEEIQQEISILEQENARDRQTIKGRLSIIKTLRRMTNTSATGLRGISAKEDPESLSPLASKCYMHLRKHGPTAVDMLAKGVDATVQMAAMTIAKYPKIFRKNAAAKWEIVPREKKE